MLKRKFISLPDIIILTFQILLSKSFQKELHCIYWMGIQVQSITLENRSNAVIRNPHDKDTYETVQDMIRSPRFELFRLEALSTSFLIVDGRQVLYKTVSYVNPEEFTIAIAKLCDNYLVEKYINYVNLLKQNANTLKIIQTARASD